MTFFLVRSCLLMLTFMSAAHARTEEPKLPNQGFLGDYSQLGEDPESSLFHVFRLRRGVLAEYDSCIIDPVLVFFSDQAGSAGFDPSELMTLTVYFREQVREELSKIQGLKIVEEPGPRTARLRLAITGVNASKGWVNAGVKLGVTAAGGVGLLIPSLDVGGISMEGEVIDSVSQERLAAFVDSKKGRRMMNFSSFKKWGDSKKALRKWAKTFRKAVEKAREARKGSEQP